MKSKFCILLALIMLLSFAPVIGEEAQTKVIENVYESFQDWQTGAVKPTEWMGAIAAGNYANPNVSSMYVISEDKGNKFLKLYPCGTMQYYIPDNSSLRKGITVLEFDYLKTALDTESKICLTYKTKRGAASNIIFDTLKNIKVSYGDGETNKIKNVGTYKANEWYKVRLELDNEKNIFSLFVNGVCLADKLQMPPYSWQNSAGFELEYDKGCTGFKIDNYSTASLDSTTFTNVGEIHIDNVSFYAHNGEGNELFPEKIINYDEIPITEEYPGYELYSGVHPRLLMDKEKAAEIWSKCSPGGKLHKEWLVEETLLSKIPEPINEVSSSRGIGNNMEHLAIGYLLSGNETYYELAVKWAKEVCSWVSWPEANDLVGSHDMIGLATVYDVFYHKLDTETRELIRNKIILQLEFLYEGVNNLDSGIAQNHTLMKAIGLLVGALAIYDEFEPAKAFVTLAKKTIDQYLSLWGPDGAYFEGYGYWEYFLEYSFRYMDLARKFFNVNHYEKEYFRKTADYGMYMLLPMESWTKEECITNLADSDLSHWYGPSYLFRKLAAEYKNENIQWCATKVRDSGIDALAAMWLSLLWYDTELPEVPYGDKMPTMKHFEDLGIISSRTDWSGKETALTFICGPAMGHNINILNQTDPYVDWGAGHRHNDNNHFTIFANGEWLINDNGYSTAKKTSNHNTLLINGKGQLGEGSTWFDSTQEKRANIRVKKAISTPEYDYFIGDAAESYPKDTALKTYDRHMIFLKPDVLIVIDNIRTGKPASFELRFFPQAQNGVIRMDGSYQSIGKNTRLRIEPLATSSFSLKADNVLRYRRVVADAKEEAALILTKPNSTGWLNITAFTWSRKDELPPRVYSRGAGGIYTFEVEGKKILFNLNDETVRLLEN